MTKKDPAGNSSKSAVAPQAIAPAKAESPKGASLFDTTPEPGRSHGADGPVDSSSRPSYAASETDEDEEIREAFAEVEAEEDDEAA